MAFVLEIRVGLLEQTLPVDAWVLPTNTEVAFASPLAFALASVAGPALESDAAANAPLALGMTARADAHVEGVRHVLLAAVHGYRAEDLAVPLREGTASSDEILAGAMQRVLRYANELGCASLALPSLAEPVTGYPVDAAATAMLQACWRFVEEHPDTSIANVTIVLDDADDAESFARVRASLEPTERAALAAVERALAERLREAERERAAREREAVLQAQRDAAAKQNAERERQSAERERRAAAERDRERAAREEAARVEEVRRREAERVKKMFAETQTLKMGREAMAALRRPGAAQAEEPKAEDELEGFGDDEAEGEATEVRPPKR
jgi:O-acetyl-ADP-ribose deacetylase (regulator of RNase III)